MDLPKEIPLDAYNLDLDLVDREAGRFPEDIADLVWDLTARLRIAERVADAARDVGIGDEPEHEVLADALRPYNQGMCHSMRKG